MGTVKDDRTTAPYGSWISPITADIILAGTVTLGEIGVDGDSVYWLEGRAREAGRNVLVRRSPNGTTSELTPPPFNVRTRVHEYGGGSYTVSDGTVYFSNFEDNRLYRLERGGEPQPLTPGGPLRYADFILDHTRNRLICVREDHTESDQYAINTVAAVNLDDGSKQQVLAEGNDFYSSPRLSPDGQHLAWLTWNHPSMPWDGTELWVAEIGADGGLTGHRLVAGGKAESIFGPVWSPDGRLYFVSDRTGWWNIYRVGTEGIEEVTKEEAEFGVPQWVFGLSTYVFTSPEQIVCSVQSSGMSRLARVDTGTLALTPIDTPYVSIGGLQSAGNRVLFLAGSATELPEIVSLKPETGDREVIATSGSIPVSPDYFSEPQSIEFPTSDGETAHAIYYPPHNPDFRAPDGERPPLIVSSHGGPTGATSAALSLSNVQYWTSRGFAVVDVNYGGSTGYGRPYRERLKGQWGVVDVQDCVAAARYLVDRGLADERRLIIHGGSAGGYTTLAALAFTDAFTAGASYYGVADIEALGEESHKFEMRYDESLVGTLPEAEDLYRQRSPIYHIDRITCPVILFQGEDDKVVPPSQARVMIDAFERKGLPYAAIFYEGEGHGFRKAENRKRTMESELYFYSRIFDFPLGEQVEGVPIHNLSAAPST